MPLPWPFRHQEPTGQTPAADTLAGRSELRGPGSAGVGGWSDLPPIQRVVEEPPLVAPARRFRAGLAGAHSPPPILQRLGHERSPDAPAGLVLGIVNARPLPAHGPVTGSLPVRAASAVRRMLQRRLALGRAVSSSEAYEEPDTVPPPGAASAAAEGPAGAPPGKTVVEQPPAPPTVDEPGSSTPLPVISRSIDARARQRLTTVDPDVLARPASPESVAGPAQASAAEPTLPAPPAMGRPASIQRLIGPSRRVRLGPPLPREEPQPLASQVPQPSADRQPNAQPPASPEAPQGGSTAPLVGAGDPPTISRLTEGSTPSATAGTPGERSDQEIPLPPGILRRAVKQRDDDGDDPGAAPAAIDAGGPAPAVQRRETTSEAGGRAPAGRLSTPHPGFTPVIARAAIEAGRLSGHPVSPLVGQRPLQPTRPPSHPGTSAGEPALQRGMEQSTPRATAGTLPSIHRGERVSEAARQLGARAFTAGGEIYIPSEAGSLERGEGRALLAHELTHARQQRQLGDTPAPASAEHGRALEAEARRAESWSMSGDLALAGWRPVGSGAAAAMGSAAAVTARLPAGSAFDAGGVLKPSMASATTINAQPDSPMVVQTAPASEATPSGPDTAAEASAAPPAAMGERELEDLLRRLYPKLRFHLANELLVARERSGLLVDLR